MICFDEFLILFSLLMLIVMTLNRYIAFQFPIRYKLLFNRRNMCKIICIILVTTICQFLAMLIPHISFVFAEANQIRNSFNFVLYYDFGYFCYECCKSDSDFRFLSYIIWSHVKFLIVCMLSCLMVFVYVRVSMITKQSMWDPLIKTLRRQKAQFYYSLQYLVQYQVHNY